MKTSNILDEMSIRSGIRKVFMLLLGTSLMTNALLAAVLAFKTDTHTTTLTPPEIRRTMTISNVAFGKEYLEEVAVYNAWLLLNMTPHTADHQLNQLLRFTAPEYKDALEKELTKTALRLKQQNVSTYFTGLRAAADVSNNTVVVDGTFEAKHNNKIIQSEERQLLISYRNSNGTIELMSIKEVLKDNQQPPVDEAEMKKHELNNPEPQGVTTASEVVNSTVVDFEGGVR